MKGILYLIPTVLGEQDPALILPKQVLDCISRLTHFAVENEKTARRFIKKACPEKVIETLQIKRLDNKSTSHELNKLIQILKEGNDLGIISEAGVPGIADPGSNLVAVAHERGYKVCPLVGPSSILLAAMAAGMNGQSFAFNGYLPIDKSEKKNSIISLEKRSRSFNQTQIFMETPYRNNQMVADLIKYCHPETRLCIACDISLETEMIKTLTIHQWKNQTIDLHKRPAIFCLNHQ